MLFHSTKYLALFPGMSYSVPSASLGYSSYSPLSPDKGILFLDKNFERYYQIFIKFLLS
jgi:hypothetical protein